MKQITNYFILASLFLLGACAEQEADVTVKDADFPFRLVFDSEEGSDLPDAEDYGIEIAFADDNRDFPDTEIVLSYTLTGSDDFSNVSIDEIIYEYEEDDCVFIREIEFTGTTITLPVDIDLNSVPEVFEVVVAFNLAGDEATEGGFTFEITGITTESNVVFNSVNAFEYEILDNDLAGAWGYELADEDDFGAWQEVFGAVSSDLAALTYADFTGSIAFEFEFEEMVIEFELEETEEVSECEDGETETSEENLLVEIEADWDAEDGEFELEGSFFDEDGEEVDFLLVGEYAFDVDDNLLLTVTSILNADGDELFSDSQTFTLWRD